MGFTKTSKNAEVKHHLSIFRMVWVDADEFQHVLHFFLNCCISLNLLKISLMRFIYIELGAHRELTTNCYVRLLEHYELILHLIKILFKNNFLYILLRPFH
jgi:hypothetical protein